MVWSGAERRKYIRRKFPCNILILTPDEHVIRSYTEDISENGVMVCVGERIPERTRVYLEIYLDDEPIFCRGDIVWVRETKTPDGNISYETGIEIKARDHY